MAKKQISEYVNLALKPFQKPDGTIILIGQDGSTLEFVSDEGLLVIELANYYTKSQTYSNVQVNSILDNYYTKGQSEAKFLVDGTISNGVFTINDGNDTLKLQADYTRVEFSNGVLDDYYTEYKSDSIVINRDSLTEYQPFSIIVENGSGTLSILDTDVTGAIRLQTGSHVNEFSTDGTFSDDSDSAVPTEKAVKTYVDTILSGTINISGTPGSFAVGDALTLSLSGCSLVSEGLNNVTIVGNSTNPQIDLKNRTSNGIGLYGIRFTDSSLSIKDASGSTVCIFDDNLGLYVNTDFKVGLGDTINGFNSSGTVNLTGGFAPTELGMVNFVNANTITTSAGGIISDLLGNTNTLSANEIILESSTGKATYSSTGIEVSGGAWNVTTVTSGGPTVTSFGVDEDGRFKLVNGVSVNSISNDIELSSSSETSLVTENAVKQYVDATVRVGVNYANGSTFTVPVTAGEIYIGVSTASTAVQVNLPPVIQTGTKVYVKDESNNANSNNITVVGKYPLLGNIGYDIDVAGNNSDIIDTDLGGKLYIFANGLWRIFNG